MIKLSPSATNYLYLIRDSSSISHLKQIHCHLLTGGLWRESAAEILRVATSCQSGDVNYASLVFHQIRKQGHAFVWNAMMRGYSMASFHERSVALLAEMLREGVLPNEHTYPLLLKSLSKSNDRNPSQFHAQIVKLGFESDIFVQNSLVSAYANGGYWLPACLLFRGLSCRDSISWTALITGLMRNNFAEKGLAMFMDMRVAGVGIDEMTIVSVLRGCGMLGNVWLGRCIHGFYVECGRVSWDVYVGSVLVDMYMKCGIMQDARKLFDEICYKNVITWTALITGYMHCNKFREALAVFQNMLRECYVPNEATLSAALTACAQLGALDQGRWIHGSMHCKFELNSVVGTALIDMYARCGCIDDALNVFKKLPKKDVYPWTAMIYGLAMHGDASASLSLFSCMLEERVLPNEVTFIGVLSACSQGGLVDQGRMYFDQMLRIYGIKPKLEHYGCMVDLLGRAGHFDEAVSFINSMPMEPSAGVWGALYGGCMNHKNVELGEIIGKHLIKLQPQHSGRYMLLANMYSAAGKWEEAAHVRMIMKGRQVDKIPGCSWIEVNGVLHEFIAFDKSHSQSLDIYGLLDQMGLQLELAGKF